MKLCLVGVCVALCPLAGATIICEFPSLKLRSLVVGSVSQGRDPLILRLRALRDRGMGKILRAAARRRSIRILVDETSPELEALAKDRPFNLEIRIAETRRAGWFRGYKLTHSFCMRLEKGSFTTVYAEPVWRTGAFHGKAEEVIESGGPIWEESPRRATAFEWEFDQARPIEWASMHGSPARPMPPPACLLRSWTSTLR